MMKDEYEIIIIGGGPGGLSAAIELAKNKKSVLLLEKNKEIGPKVCAGGLTTKINELGISLDIADRKFSTIKANINNKKYSISLPQPFIATVDRKKFGQYLLQKALTGGAEVRTNTAVKEISPDFVATAAGKIKYKYLIGADGSLSMVRKYLGLKTKTISCLFQYIIPRELADLEIFLDIERFGSGYAWIFPHQGYTSIGFGQDAREIRGKNLKKTLYDWCANMKINLHGAAEQSWIINNDYQGWHFDNSFLVGDASGFTPSLTGEGIYYAMVSGQEAARKIINPGYSCPQIKKILKKKSRQEKLLRVMQLNPGLFCFCYASLISLTKYRWLADKVVRFFS